MNNLCEECHHFGEMENLPQDSVVAILKCERCRLMALRLKGNTTKTMGYDTPQWTSDKPVTEGWYWFRIVGEVDRTVVQVTINDDGYLQAEEPSSWIERGDLVDTSTEEWAGPIEEPPA